MPRRLLLAALASLPATPLLAQQVDSLAARHPAWPTIQPTLSQTAGVQVTPHSGMPGDWSAVTIRGAAALQGLTAPLYVVDDVPVFQNEREPERLTTWFQNNPNFTRLLQLTPNPLLSLSPADIDSVEVLKSPVALARYGGQGRHGVIRIRTRRGTADQGPRVQYGSYVGLQQLRRRYELLDAQAFGTVANEAAANSNLTPPYSPAQLAALGRGTDWQAEVYRAAVLHEHHAAVSGGTARTQYYVGAGALLQDGVMRNSTMQRYNLRANVDQQLGRLTLSARVGASQVQQRQPQNVAAVVQGTLLAPPTLPIRDGQGLYTSVDPLFGYQPNPVYLQERNYRKPRARRLLAQLSAEYRLDPSLTLTARASTEQLGVRQDSYGVSFLRQPPSADLVTQTDQQQSRTRVLELGGRYHRRWAELHELHATLTAQHQHYYQDWQQDYNIPDVIGGSFSQGGAREELRFGLLTPSATATYSYAGRYELQTSLRVDAFNGNQGLQKAQAYPGVQASWLGSREAFMPAVPGLDEWKLWVGAGRIGGQIWLPETVRTISLPGAPLPPYTIHSTRPEYDLSTEAGLRTQWLGQRLSLELVAYRRHSQQLLLPGAVFNLYPATGPAATAAVRNQGLELSTSLRWRAGRVSGLTALVASTNQNRVQDLPPDFLFTPRLIEGKPLSVFWGTRQDGLYPAGGTSAGQPRVRDLNGNGMRGDIGDQEYLGSGLPKQLLTLTQTLLLGHLQVEAQINGMFGYQLYNPTLALLDRANDRTNSSTRVRDRWTPATPDAPLPAATSANSFYNQYLFTTTDQSVSDASHLRLSQLTLRYPLRQQPTSTVELWVGAQNLLVLTRYRGYDPNVSSAGANSTWAGYDDGAYPVPRTWLLGVNASF